MSDHQVSKWQSQSPGPGSRPATGLTESGACFPAAVTQIPATP